MQPGKLRRYIREYNWSSIFEMIRNMKAEPECCADNARGRLVVITGATSGIGYATAMKYARHGASLLCINRNEEKSLDFCSKIRADFGVRCDYLIADMGRMKDVFRVGNELAGMHDPIDVFIHNAGLYMTKRQDTEDGLETVFAVDYLSSFILNYLLIDKLSSQDKARILMVNSEGHRFAAWGLRLDDLNWDKRRYTGLRSYGSAKMAQLLSVISFAERFQGTGVTINAMHPGAVRSQTGKENGRLYKWLKRELLEKSLRSPEISAEALYYLGVSEAVEAISGKFFNLTREEEPAPPALDRQAAQELWDVSMSLGGLNEQP